MTILLSLLGLLGLGGGVGIAALLGGGPWMLMAAKWVWGWLSHATFLQVACALLIVALGVDHVALIISHRHSVKVEGQLSDALTARDNYKHQLDAISARKNEQRVQTQTRIVQVTKTIHDADKRAQIVENAPPAPNCKTNKEVLSADL